MFTVLCLSRFTTIFFFLLSVILFQIIDTLVHWQKTHGPVLILFLYPLRLGSLSEFHIHLANSSWISPLLQCTLIIFPQAWASLVTPLSAKGVPVRLGGQVISDVVFSASTPYPPVTKLYWPVPWMCLEFIHSPHFNPSRCHSCPFY